MKQNASPDGRDEQRMRWNAFARAVASSTYEPTSDVLMAGLDAYAWVVDAVELAVLNATPATYVPEDGMTNPYRWDDDGDP